MILQNDREKTIYQSSLENGNPTPVDAQGRVGIDDGGVGEVVAIDGNELVDIRLLKQNFSSIQVIQQLNLQKKRSSSFEELCSQIYQHLKSSFLPINLVPKKL